ncbi:MAG: hypothetical protein LBB63_03045 [Holosporaceae bacterium]|jgi:hypothetical protein|nr:hypothetical protein [Holosporaceae bacterium]
MGGRLSFWAFRGKNPKDIFVSIDNFWFLWYFPGVFPDVAAAMPRGMKIQAKKQRQKYRKQKLIGAVGYVDAFFAGESYFY